MVGKENDSGQWGPVWATVGQVGAVARLVLTYGTH